MNVIIGSILGNPLIQAVSVKGRTSIPQGQAANLADIFSIVLRGDFFPVFRIATLGANIDMPPRLEGAAWGVVVVGAAVVSGAAASGAEEFVSSKAEDSVWELSSGWETSGDAGCTVAEASKADSVWETAEEVPSS